MIAVADSSTLLEQGVEYAAPSVRPVSLSRIISFVRICVGLGISTPSGRKTTPQISAHYVTRRKLGSPPVNTRFVITTGNP